MDDIKTSAEIKERTAIQTLNQTRKIQVKNFRKIFNGQNSNRNINIGMTAFLRNPNTTRKNTKRNIHEPSNVKVKILKTNSISSQYYVEYNYFILFFFLNGLHT